MTLTYKIMEIETREVKPVKETIDIKAFNDYMIQDYSRWKSLLYQPIENKESTYRHDMKSDPNFDFIF